MPPRAATLLRLCLLAVAGYYAIWGGEYSALDLRRLHAIAEEKATDNVVARLEVDSIRVRVEALENDPAAIERIAREKFGMIRENELLYRFVEIPADQPSAQTKP